MEVHLSSVAGNQIQGGLQGPLDLVIWKSLAEFKESKRQKPNRSRLWEMSGRWDMEAVNTNNPYWDVKRRRTIEFSLLLSFVFTIFIILYNIFCWFSLLYLCFSFLKTGIEGGNQPCLVQAVQYTGYLEIFFNGLMNEPMLN